MARVRVLLLPAMLLFSSRALAQTRGEDLAAAQVMFEDGKRLMAARNYEEACPKLVESQRLDPAGGTLFAIALCHEAQGKTATAWADFNLALGEARKDHRADREKSARDHIHALELKMPRVRIVVASKTDHVEVRRDGALVGAAQWGSAIPIDPGEHRFEASAQGKKGWAQTLVVRGEAQTLDVNIPALEDAPRETPPVVPPTPVPTTTTAPPPAPVPSALPPPAPDSTHASAVPGAPASHATRDWGLLVGGLGLVSVGIGTAFGFTASSKWHDADRACPGGKCTDPQSLRLGADAGRAADFSTGFVLVGAAGVVAAAVLLLLPGDSSGAKTARVRVTPMIGGVNGVSLGGSL